MIELHGYRFTPRLVPTLMMLAMVAVLLALGVWQVQRAGWKKEIITHYRQQDALPALTALPPPAGSEGAVYRHVVLGGKFQNHLSIPLRPRVVAGRMGYDLVTPLRLYTGEVVLVLRGFVPDETKEFIDQPIGTVAVSGVLRPFSARTWRPENRPDKDQWYWIDPEAIATSHKLEKPYPLLLVAADKPVNTPWPAPQPVIPYFHDFHALYAATWFFLAAVLVGIYLRVHIRKL